MTLTLKYIITRTGAILFNDNTVHLAVAHGFKQLEKETEKQQVFSAGFVELQFNGGAYIDKIKCFGGSTSMNLQSNPEKDEEVIQDLFEEHSKIKYYGFNVAELYGEQ